MRIITKLARGRPVSGLTAPSVPVPSTPARFNHPRLKRWLWFVGIYAGSVLAFAAVTGILEFCLPK